MKLWKNIGIYALILFFFASGLWGVLRLGSKFENSSPKNVPTASSGLPAEVPERSPSAPITLLLLQIIVILTASRAMAKMLRTSGQPEVVGEILAGICLGPSVLGFLWPASQNLLFPASSLDNLQLFSNFGLIVFMFIVGIELRPGLLLERAGTTVWISHASIAVPFVSGAALSLLLYRGYAPAGIDFAPFCLFLGIAMSITAFPVLARIIREKNLTQSAVGTVSLACAAVDDVTAWCALAAVVGFVKRGSAFEALRVAAQCAVWIGAMAWIVRPALRWWISRQGEAERRGHETTAIALIVALASAWVTEKIGVHALFGAFLAGVLMPQETAFRQALAGYLEKFTLVALLPVFFTLSGLRTRVGLLQDAAAWAACGAILVTAIAGKIGAGAAAARWSGMSWRESLSVGALMNTRGLIELVVLNIGYDLGVIPPSVFAMLVLMAVATTIMTGPLLSWICSEPIPVEQAPRVPL